MASSSSPIDSSDNDDVFLSFRGKDTRYNIITHLRKELRRNDIKFFIDDEIDRGDEITEALERAIEGARISIIVFSPNYASSSACLHELVKIMECKKSKAQLVFPIFYKVEPLEATYQEAFDEHKAKFDGKKECTAQSMGEEMKKVEKWKSAFVEALELAGWHIKEESDEADIIDKVTKTVLEKLNSSQSKGEKLMYKPMVGHTADNIFEKIWECLMNDKVLRVGIYGMGGVGKTTIATRVYDELCERAKSFTHVCWVTVSKDLSIWKLQNEIANMIMLDLSKEDDKLKRAAKLRQRLRSEKFVLILDDVWEAFEIEDVGIPHLVGAQKLLLTSRSRRVCEGMECKPIQLKPLSEQEALDLFVREHKYKIKDSPEWREIVHSIVGECAGLPLAIVVIARRMRELVEICEWRNVLRKLKEPCKVENHEMEEKVYKPLKLSYDSLPDYQYQQCFLYCSLFPEDHIQRRDRLIEYLIGEGLVGELDSRQVELDLANAIINELINASLLEVTTGYLWGRYVPGGMKMHDVVRDMAEIVIRENLKAQEGLKLQDLSKETKRCFNLKSVFILDISVFESDVPYLPPNASKLTTLSSDRHLFLSELPSGFFANMQNLSVLDMSGMSYLMLLPDSISYLENLRVLRLHGCVELKYIPSLAKLKNLRYLDFSHTRLKKIPKGMEKLINLRVLKMSSVNFLNAFFSCAFLKKLSNLQMVNFLNAFFSCAFLKKLSDLQMLEIDNAEVKADEVISLKKLKALTIVFYNLESLNSYFKSGHWKSLQEYFIGYFRKKDFRKAKMWKEGNECEKVLVIEELGDSEISVGMLE